VLAAIDCGTNSTRLLISEGTGADRRTLDRQMVITRLGQGVDATGRLDPAAIDRTVEVLRRYRRALDEHGVEAVRITATSAARDAANAADFFDAAEAVVGVRPELIAGDEEGALSFAGATGELDPADGPFLVVDIGGGSTECIVGTDHVEAVRSLDIGCVRLTEKHLHSDPPAPEELSNAVAEAIDHFDELLREVPQVMGARTVVGLAGTVSTVAAVEIGLPEYDRAAIHHFRLTRAAAEDVFRTLATEALADRVHNPGLEAARADVIVGGCCALVALLRTLGIDELLVSESDILDGLVLSLAQVHDPTSPDAPRKAR
jgi:exopolyphosphatase/guanosine-5'-triphosphate,3'-diphosphate pyrophosphatase